MENAEDSARSTSFVSSAAAAKDAATARMAMVAFIIVSF
jgi:hypothetical protein